MASFVQDNIICRVVVPKHILSDNCTPFVNSYVRELSEQYGIDLVKSNPYYLRRMVNLRPPMRLN